MLSVGVNIICSDLYDSNWMTDSGGEVQKYRAAYRIGEALLIFLFQLGVFLVLEVLTTAILISISIHALRALINHIYYLLFSVLFCCLLLLDLLRLIYL